MRKERSAVKSKLMLKRGLFQGDSLSPPLFCLIIVFISHALREMVQFKVLYLDTPATHLFFMDDLKVYAENQEVLGDTVKVADRVSHVVGMELGLQKCAIVHIKCGKVVDRENYLLPEEWMNERVAQGGTYQYLGIEQVFKSSQTAIREYLTKVYAKCLQGIWYSSLVSKHKVHATNIWAVAVFRHFFVQVKLPDKATV